MDCIDTFVFWLILCFWLLLISGISFHIFFVRVSFWLFVYFFVLGRCLACGKKHDLSDDNGLVLSLPIAPQTCGSIYTFLGVWGDLKWWCHWHVNRITNSNSVFDYPAESLGLWCRQILGAIVWFKKYRCWGAQILFYTYLFTNIIIWILLFKETSFPLLPGDHSWFWSWYSQLLSPISLFQSLPPSLCFLLHLFQPQTSIFPQSFGY